MSERRLFDRGLTVRVLDAQFNLLGEIDDFEDVVLYRNYVTFGDFEGRIAKRKHNTEHLAPGNLFLIDDERCGIIEYREDEQDKEQERIFIRGRTPEKLLGHRITMPPKGAAQWQLTGPTERVIKTLAADNLGTAAGQDRHIPELSIAPDLGRGANVSFDTAYRPLDEDIKSLCLNAGMGIKVTFDTHGRRFVLEVVVGKNLSASQQDYPPVIFASEFDNILEQRIVNSFLDYKNTAITAGAGEGAKREVIIVYEEDTPCRGMERREVFADIRDSDITSAALPGKGREKLEETPRLFTLEGVVNPFQHNAVLGTHFNLGDVVTRRYGDTVKDVRVTELTETWDSQGYNLECVFGEPLPTLLDKIKNGVR